MISGDSSSTTLECGRDLLALVEQVTDGTPPAEPEHQAVCAFCQEALCRIRTATDQLRAMAGELVTVPAGLARRVMAQLRRERGRVPLAAASGGADSVSDLVVTQITRRAALSIEGVRHCSVELAPATGDGDLTLAVHLTADLGPDLAQLAELVRQAVIDDLSAFAGLRAGLITVDIADVHLP